MNNISMHILDIVQNAIRAQASLIEIRITEDLKRNVFEVLLKDNGKGMDNELLTHVADPYITTRTTRKVGLGIPLLKHSAEQANGYIKVHSEQNIGTTILATFQHDHMDRPPLGDCAGTIVLLASANPEIDFKYIHSVNDKSYTFDTREVKEVLDDVKISNPKIRGMLKEMISENLNEIYVV
ncbi:MAG: ATP-binding protein [Bacteroidetes bacterium]|nr:ATP-binding protein [Bacteroidota bacterium]